MQQYISPNVYGFKRAVSRRPTRLKTVESFSIVMMISITYYDSISPNVYSFKNGFSSSNSFEDRWEFFDGDGDNYNVLRQYKSAYNTELALTVLQESVSRRSNPRI